MGNTQVICTNLFKNSDIEKRKKEFNQLWLKIICQQNNMTNISSCDIINNESQSFVSTEKEEWKKR